MNRSRFPNFLERSTLFTAEALCCFMITLVCTYSVDGANSSAVYYRDIENMGNSCPWMDSCAHRRTMMSRRQQVLVKERSCYCDGLCPEYGDCCVDAPSSKRRGKRNGLHCLHVEHIGGVYMKDSCPTSYTGPEEVRRRCERTKVGDQADPLGSLPVTDSTTGLTYKNYYCHLCEEKPSGDVVMWSPKLECPLLVIMNASGNMTSGYVLKNLVTDGRRWGLYLDDESDGSKFFHDCHVYPVMPPQLAVKVRQCQPHLVSDCPASWSDDRVRSACRSYTGSRFDAEGNAYRNVHCAVCNGAEAARLSCRTTEDVDIFRELGIFSFAILLDISQTSGEVVGKVESCRRGEFFDPFFKKCRSVQCLPGYVRRGRRCVANNPSEFARFLSRINEKRSVTSTTPKYQKSERIVTVNPVDIVPTAKALNITLKTA